MDFLSQHWFGFPDHGTALFFRRLPIFSYTLSTPNTHVDAHPHRMEASSTIFSAEAYFETQPPPSTIELDVQSVRSFLKQQQEHGRKVVLVTVRDVIASHIVPSTLI